MGQAHVHTEWKEHRHHDAPSLLPGSHDVLVSRTSGGGERGLVLVSTADGRVTDLNMAGYSGSYSGGRVVFARPFGMVFSAPFSLRKRAFTGPATLLLQGVRVVTTTSSEIAVAGNGTLVYMVETARFRTRVRLAPSILTTCAF